MQQYNSSETKTYKPFVGGHPPIMTPGTLAGGAEDRTVLPGTPLGVITADGNWVEWDPAAVDGSEVCKGISVTEMPVGANVDEPTSIYRHGEFIRSGLQWPDTASDSEINSAVADLAAVGIFVK